VRKPLDQREGRSCLSGSLLPIDQIVNDTIHHDRSLAVAELTQVNVALDPVGAFASLLSAEEDVAGRLHQMLLADHPFALIPVTRALDESRQHRGLGYIWISDGKPHPARAKLGDDADRNGSPTQALGWMLIGVVRQAA
jgi:hypothetical protein